MITHSSNETKQLAQKVLNDLGSRHVIALYGDLGSGKTTFTQGLAESLKVSNRILSPTFVLLRSYKLVNQKFKTLHHLDLYRTTTLEDAKTSGLEELLEDTDALVVIEWPEVIETLLPSDAVKIKLRMVSEDEREIVIS